MKLIGHCLVKNEENFIWFAINSVIDYLDEILVWDNGSSDQTIEIIKTIQSPKIKFRQIPGQVSNLRQQMLAVTEGEWIFVLDGDEIWSESAIRALKKQILAANKDVVVVPNYMLVGDLFHYLEPAAGQYRIAGRVGHYNIRAIRKLVGLQVQGVYPNEAFVTKEGTRIQNLPVEKIAFLEEPYLHASFLPRSRRDNKKMKYEIGLEFAKDFYYPEVFFRDRPSIIPYPFQPMSRDYRLIADLVTPLKKLRRRFK